VTAAELRVLGPVEVVGDDGPVRLAAKHRRLLAALAIGAGRPCSVDELVEVLWDGAAPASARKLVQVYVSQLRAALPEGIGIATHAGSYALDVARDGIDAGRFERLLGEAAAAGREANHALAASLAGQALALWRGRAYGELAYEDFARSEAERLDELRLEAVEERIDAQLALGRHGEVVAQVLALAHEHPLRERLQGQAMLALYRCGRQTEALEHFAAAREQLVGELGLEPGARLRELQRRILVHDAALDPPAEGSHAGGALPVPATPLVGREEELGALGRLLGRREARLLVLTGAGGSGKTRLALEAARNAAGSFANGVVLVELAPLRDAQLVATAVAQALDVHEAADEPLETTLATALAPKELLLIVDNAEHVRDAASLFARLVARAPRLTVLVTSRAVLHVSGEHVFPVAPLGERDAVELFVQRARQLDPSFGRAPENELELREICRRLDGLPLAIELAAARIRALTPDALVERLSSRLTLLTAGPRDLPARQQTLRETIDWSVDLLSHAERRVLGRLAVFPGGATLAAAEAVCGADVDTLAGLVDHNLVRRLDTDGEPRFGLLETIREYAYDLLGDDRPSAERDLLEYLTSWAEPADLHGLGQPVWNARLDAELDNLRAALDVASAGPDREIELQLAGKLWRYWWVRGYSEEGLARLEGALDRGRGVVSRHRARALHGLAGLAWSRGDFDLAVTRASEAVDVARACGALYEEGLAHTVLGIVANHRKDFETARRHHERSIAITEALGVEPNQEKLNLAIVAMDSGDLEAAIQPLEEVLASHRRHDIAQGIGFAALNLGLARYGLGDHAEARGLFAEAGDAFTRIRFRAHVGHALQGAGACEAAAGRHEEAARLLGAASVELGDVVYSEEEFPALAARAEAAARAAIGDDAFALAYEAGRAAAS
jgi:predicted ATPase/DNA-binding SARP family transcriptional activator